MQEKVLFKEKKDFWVDYVENTTEHSLCQIHNVYELCYFISGQRTVVIDGNTYTAKANSIMVNPPYVQHSTFGKLPVTRFTIYFSARFLQNVFSHEFIDRILSHISAGCYSLTAKKRAQILHELVKAEFESNNPQMASLHICEILFMLNDTIQNSVIRMDTTKNDLVASVTQYIEQNLGAISTLQEIADAVHFSPSYMSSCFKKKMDMTIMQYVARSRINHAARLLTETSLPISMIASQCGFSDSAYFCNVFRKEISVSPSKYRAIIRSNPTGPSPK